MFAESVLEKNIVKKRSNSANAFAKKCFAKPVLLKKFKQMCRLSFLWTPKMAKSKSKNNTNAKKKMELLNHDTLT